MMKLTAKLALSQIKTNRSRSMMTLLGIVLSSAMLTAVCGYVSSAKTTLYKAFGYDSNAAPHTAIIAMGAVLGVIIIAASVIVVSNAFRVSAGERTRQFGILKSVGATKKQIAASVLYEGVFLSAIGIPAGIAVGLLLDLLGTSVLTNLLHSMHAGGTLNVDSEAVLTVPFTAPPLMFVIAAVTSFGTVLLSAWVPARRAAKIPAIDAIRSTGEVKLNGKYFRTSKLTQKLFGFEGSLASKSLKRSRRSFRATVLSLTISIVLLIAAGSFGSLIERSSKVMFGVIDATAIAEWLSERTTEFDDSGKVSGVSYLSLDLTTAELITEKLRGYDGAEIFGIGSYWNYETLLPDGAVKTGALVSVDRKNYEALCKTAGVPVGSNILVNLRREASEGNRKEYVPYNFSEIEGKMLTFTLPNREPIEVTVDGQLTGQDVPGEINLYWSEIVIITPDCESPSYVWYAEVGEPMEFSRYADQILTEFAPPSTDTIDVNMDCYDITSIMKQMSDLYGTIMFFVYGFVGMLTLIAVTSVISTINTNIRSRTREFAVLESVGMTKSGVKKMLNLESILCSARSLILGIPLGIGSAYALYRAMGFSVEVPFSFPWLLVTECVIGIFAVTWITMRYSASRLKKGSIVETIRGE